METLTFTRSAKLQDGGVYCEWHPTNEGLNGLVYHSKELTINGTVKDTLDAYEPTACSEIHRVIEETFPGMYQLPVG